MFGFLKKPGFGSDFSDNQRLQSGAASSKTYPPPSLPRHRHQNMRIFCIIAAQTNRSKLTNSSPFQNIQKHQQKSPQRHCDHH
ncbi:hypothetical protein Hanom_Chr10g00913511 [Helianthus anomalus]